ncbi:MAG: tyrosine-type recombinase/integrase [Gemmatimonadaceae bacterium]|nr:tyrosine-type recombinase/integrase [Gemmatimonadaceae bacterium]
MARNKIFFEFYERVPDTDQVRRVRISAGHNDRTAAKSKADELAAAFSKPERARVSEATLNSLFDIYMREVTPMKGASKRAHDHRAAELFKRSWGGNRKISTLNRRDWDKFIHERRRGTLRPVGRKAKENETGVRDRQIAYDLKFLLSVFNWAMTGGDGRGNPLLERNPLKGLPIPREESPRRPLLSDDQYQALQRVGAQVGQHFELALILAHETGHRIGAIRQLRWNDVDLKERRIVWRAENDKIGMEHVAPLSDEAVRALEKRQKENPAIGNSWLFPSPANPSTPCSRHLVRDWWRRAAKRAKLSSTARLGWHSLRRKFVNDMKSDTPMADLCHLGGWRSALTVMTVYQQADQVTMRSALRGREERRASLIPRESTA